MIPATTIAIEGPDRCGKATQSRMLVQALQDQGYKVKLVEVPVKSVLSYKIIYWLLRNGFVNYIPNVFQFVQFVNKWFFQVFKFTFMRWFFDFIIFDRWALSGVVYGDAGGANPRFSRFLFRRLRKPDATIILVGMARTSDVTDAYEANNKLQMNVRRGYADWYIENRKGTAIVDNDGSRNDVHNRIMNVVDKKFDLL